MLVPRVGYCLSCVRPSGVVGLLVELARQYNQQLRVFPEQLVDLRLNVVESIGT